MSKQSSRAARRCTTTSPLLQVADLGACMIERFILQSVSLHEKSNPCTTTSPLLHVPDLVACSEAQARTRMFGWTLKAHAIRPQDKLLHGMGCCEGSNNPRILTAVRCAPLLQSSPDACAQPQPPRPPPAALAVHPSRRDPLPYLLLPPLGQPAAPAALHRRPLLAAHRMLRGPDLLRQLMPA